MMGAVVAAAVPDSVVSYLDQDTPPHTALVVQHQAEICRVDIPSWLYQLVVVDGDLVRWSKKPGIQFRPEDILVRQDLQTLVVREGWYLPDSEVRRLLLEGGEPTVYYALYDAENPLTLVVLKSSAGWELRAEGTLIAVTLDSEASMWYAENRFLGGSPPSGKKQEEYEDKIELLEDSPMTVKEATDLLRLGRDRESTAYLAPILPRLAVYIVTADETLATLNAAACFAQRLRRAGIPAVMDTRPEVRLKKRLADIARWERPDGKALNRALYVCTFGAREVAENTVSVRYKGREDGPTREVATTVNLEEAYLEIADVFGAS